MSRKDTTYVEKSTDETREHCFSGYMEIVKISVPNMLQNVIVMMVEILNVVFIGKLGDPAMVAGIGLGNATQNLCGLSVIIGLNSALDTLISQAAGQGKMELCGVYRNRGQFVMTLIFIPVVCILANSSPIFTAIGQHHEVADYAQEYIIAFLPGLYLKGFNDCQSKLLNNFKKTQISFVCAFVSLFVHVLTSWLFVLKLGYGIRGTGIAGVFTFGTYCAVMMMYTCLQNDIKETRVRPDVRMFEGIAEYLKIGVPGTVMLCLEWWVWELQMIFSGWFTVRQQASQIIMMNIDSFTFMFVIGLEVASCALLGNQIGLGNVKEAREIYEKFKTFSITIILVNSAVIYIFQEQIMGLWTSDQDLIQLGKGNIWIVCLVIIPEGIKGMQKGVIKALSLQSQTILIHIVGHWLISVSLQLLLGIYFDLRCKGLWFAKFVLEAYTMIAYTILLYLADWGAKSEEAVARILRDSEDSRQKSRICHASPSFYGGVNTSEKYLPP